MSPHYVKTVFHAGLFSAFLLNLSTTQLVPVDTNEMIPYVPTYLPASWKAHAVDTNNKAKEERGAFDGFVPKVASMARSIRRKMAWLQKDAVKALEVLPPLKEGESLKDNKVYLQWLDRAADHFHFFSVEAILQSLKTKVAGGATGQLYHWLKENKRTAEQKLKQHMEVVCSKEDLKTWQNSAQSIAVAEKLLTGMGKSTKEARAQVQRVRGLKNLWSALLVDMASDPATSKLAYDEWQAVSKRPSEIFRSLTLATKIEDPLLRTQWLEYVKWYFPPEIKASEIDEYLLRLFATEMSPTTMVTASALFRQSSERKGVSELLLQQVLSDPVRRQRLFEDWQSSGLRPEKAIEYLHLDDRHQGDSERFLFWLTYVSKYLRNLARTGTTSSFSYGDALKLLEASTTTKSLLQELRKFRWDTNVMKQTDVKSVVDDMLIFTLFKSEGSRWYDDLKGLEGSRVLLADHGFIQVLKSRKDPEEMIMLRDWLQPQTDRATEKLRQRAESSEFKQDIEKWLSSGRYFHRLERIVAENPVHRDLLDDIRQVNNLRKLEDGVKEIMHTKLYALWLHTWPKGS